MAKAAQSPVVDAVRNTAAHLQPGILLWRCGGASHPALFEARASLPPEWARHVEAVAKGDEEVASGTLALARRLHALLQNAGHVDEACRHWSEAKADVEDVEWDVAKARQTAMQEQHGPRARQLWNAARVVMQRKPLDEAAETVPRLRPLLPQQDAAVAADARAFLARTKDVWLDALDFTTRRNTRIKDAPQVLVHAQVMRFCGPDELVPTMASRHLARLLVEDMARGLPPVKRLAMPLVMELPGVACLAKDGGPRVGWVERRGVAGLLELSRLTVAAHVMAVGMEDLLVAPAVGSAAVLGLCPPPVLRKVLGLGREDGGRVSRHLATLLLREARVSASLTLANPGSAHDAMDALQEATQVDPDLVEALARTGPWPEPSPGLGPMVMEHAAQWRCWVAGATVADALRQSFDDDAVMRNVAQATVHAAVRDAAQAGPEGLATWVKSCGAQPPTHTPLAMWLEEALG